MTAEPRQVEQRIHRIFRDQLNVEVPGTDTDLFEAGALDSLSFVELLVALSDEFEREISIERLELADFRSIGAMACWLSRNGNGNGQGSGAGHGNGSGP